MSCPLSAKKKKVDFFSEWEDDTSTDRDEVDEYCGTTFQMTEELDCVNLLAFWEKQGRSFPLLQQLAKRIFSVPATSAASERCFSAAGRIIEARRNRLNPGTVDAILFLHSAKKK